MHLIACIACAHTQGKEAANTKRESAQAARREVASKARNWSDGGEQELGLMQHHMHLHHAHTHDMHYNQALEARLMHSSPHLR